MHNFLTLENESAGRIHKRVLVCVYDHIKGITATLSTANEESAYTSGTPRFLRTAATITADATL
jgi:hypothetical protein